MYTSININNNNINIKTATNTNNNNNNDSKSALPLYRMSRRDLAGTADPLRKRLFPSLSCCRESGTAHSLAPLRSTKPTK